MTLWKWSQTAANNDAIDSTINLRENQAPSTYNNAARAIMAAVAKYAADMSGNLATGGSSTAYTVTTNQVLATLTDGFAVVVRMHATSGLNPTFSPDGLAAKQIRMVYGTNVPLGALLINSIQKFTYDSTDDAWIVQGAIGSNLRYIGEVFDFAGADAPPLSLLCYGQAVSRSTYAALFAVIGTTYGSGDGSTTFNVPDLRGRVVAGQDDMGGSSANRLTNQSGGLDGDTLGATGGAETHTLTEGQMPSHSHGVTDPGHTHSYSVPQSSEKAALDNDTPFFFHATTGGATTGSNTTGISIQSAGSGQAHNNVQPTIILNKCIFAGA